MKQTISSLSFAIALSMAPVSIFAETSELGVIQFPTSGSPEAQEPFLRGVAALHNFWYEEAAEAFRRAQELEPDFALAYWGEAMTYNHPLWAEQDIAAARKTLERLAPTRKERLAKAPTEREKALFEAVEILYGPGDKLERDLAYSKAMERLHERYPEDHEIAAFYALSLLGTVRPGDAGFRRQMKSAAILERIFERNPEHPGAAHYLIHSYDDPEHAPLGLPAAERYAEIAPEAPHALHMPSHIFVQLGMWDRVAASNKAAYEASDSWVRRKGLSVTRRDYHSFSWRQYANLQRGLYREAREAYELVGRLAEETGAERLHRDHASMRSRYVIETRRWEDLPLPEAGGDGGRYDATADLLLAAGMSAAARGDFDTAEQAAARLGALREQKESEGEAYRTKPLAIMEKEVLALTRFGQGQKEQALELIQSATAIEETMDPPSGPPHPLKPSHELYGELLLEAGKPEEALSQFETSLLRTPKRAASLLGLARAAARSGDGETARRTYEELAGIWREADADLPDLAEVRGHGTPTDGRQP